MDACGDYSVDLMLYLDGELKGEKLPELLNHLKICFQCRASLDEQLALSDTLHRARPLYSAPPMLRAEIADRFARQQSKPTTGRFRRKLIQALELLCAAKWIPQWSVLAPAALGSVLCLLLVSSHMREVRAAEYVNAALSAHRDHLSGRLPLTIQTDSPATVTGWLSDKVSFPLQLPDSQQQADGKPAYRLLGATIVTYKGSNAGLVTYQVPQKGSISLLVASSNFAVVSGGAEVHSGHLVFHYRVDSGFQIITWSNHGLAYALVSAASGTANGSCLICHQSIPEADGPPSHRSF
jgi:anti-sigma factor RsiW